MNEPSSTAEDLDLSLTKQEPPIPKDDPWKYDALQRKPIADNLTNLIRDEKNPFVISVSGDWGTGKTFLLKRWQAQLEKEDFRAIYFNAWEDDFCDDPLVAIIGQLAKYFSRKELKEELKEIGKQFKENAIPLLGSILRSLSVSVAGVGIGLSLPDPADLADDVLEQYSKQTESKDQLKNELKKLACKVREETGHPLVFIIDELDRCRPTFAVALLERVKHMFDVPGMVFVFGLNRGELGKSVQSLYGEIDADIYLHRFFDMEFRLLEADARAFCEYLIEKRYKLNRFYRADVERLIKFKNFFPVFSGIIGLSLRDIDYCVRTIAFVGKNLDKNNIFASYYLFVLAALIPLKLKNQSLYQRFIQGKSASAGAEVMNCIDEWIGDKRDVELDKNNALEGYYLYDMEVSLYVSVSRRQRNIRDGRYPLLAIGQLQLLVENKENEPVTHPQYLSKRTRDAGQERASELWKVYQQFLPRSCGYLLVEDIAELIELTKPPQDR